MTDQEAKYTGEDLKRLGETWMERIRAAEKREDKWIKQAEAAEAAYLCDEDRPNDVPDFNILHSNVETIVPSLYNSTPVPDIRPSFNRKDPVGKVVADILEMAVSAQIDDNRLDCEIEKGAQDAFVAGRDVVRIKFDADVEGSVVSNEKVEYEVVSWRDYREGPAKKWKDVPWVAFRHCISQEELERYSDPELEELQVSPEAGIDTANEDDVKIWEVWCKETRKVKLIIEDTAKVLRIEDDPLELTNFFPMPEPVQPITGTGRRTPVCPYTVYRRLAEELDTQTRRINAIVDGLKVRGIIASDAEAIARLSEADDNELVPIGNIENLIAAGGLDKAIMWWPIETAVNVLRELYQQREQTKQTIYEITGISDIVRGASKATETATAQQIKTEWGSLRIKKLQNLIVRQVRDLFVLTVEVVARQFSSETLSMISGQQITPEIEAVLREPLKYFRINVESDSTIRADATRNRQEMSEFLTGTANYFNTMAPVVQQAPEAAGPIVEMYASFARQFNLGKQAEDALEQFAEMAKQAASQPRPNPEEEAAQAEAEKTRMASEEKMEQKRIDAEADVRKHEVTAMKDADKNQKDHEFRMERLSIDREALALKQQQFDHEKTARAQEAAGQMAQGADVLSGMVSEAFAAVLDEIRGGNEALAGMVAQLGAAIQDGNSQIVGAMTAPKELIRDEAGRPVGVRTVAGEQRMVN